MRQLTFIAPGRLEWREVAVSRITSAASAVVRPMVVGRCDLDTAYVRGLAPLAAGEAIGHEMIGEVTDVGDAVRLVRPGDVVICTAQICCGVCRMCLRGHTGRCEAVPFAASYGMGREAGYGCLASDLAFVPFADAMLARLPENADPVAMIGIADMALDAWRAVGPALAERPGARVLVIGGAAAVIGLYAAGLACAQGAGEVVYVDGDAGRRAQAVRFGCVVSTPEELQGPFEIVVEASGDAALLALGLGAAEPEALVTSVAIHFGASTPMPLQTMYWKGVRFSTGRPNCRAALEPVLASCAAGFRPDAIVQSLHAFDDMPLAWTDPAIRVVAARSRLDMPQPISRG